MTNILAVSDLHGFLPEVPKCDVLLIAGDITPVQNHAIDYQMRWLDRNFRAWLESLPTDNIIGIAGNHDFAFESRPKDIERLELPWLYLQDSSYKYKSVKYYGLPWVPKLQAWAFYANDFALAHRYDAIPEDTDVIISHGPPKGLGDLAQGRNSAGSDQARRALERVKPKAFVCGHIHEAFGEMRYDSSIVYNVSYVDEFYDSQSRITAIDL